ncbi:MAG: universal stress protein [Nitrospirae bacterium]|nr:MAG: universal stress protein [Nitrospirota bacterium]
MKVLCCVDETKGSLKVVDILGKIFKDHPPEKLYLLYVEKIEGPSVMDDLLLSESEMKTLKESLEGTEHKEVLDRKANKVIAFFQDKFKEKGLSETEPVIKMGHPAEEILRASEELSVDLIVMGSRGSRTHGLFIGSVSREVVNQAKVSVLVAR